MIFISLISHQYIKYNKHSDCYRFQFYIEQHNQIVTFFFSISDDARNYFKEIVNQLAVIQTEDNEKYLILKKKYRPPGYVGDFTSPAPTPSPSSPSNRNYFDAPSPNISPPRAPPPYRAPPPPASTPSPKSHQYPIPENQYPIPEPLHSLNISREFEQEAPPVPPRRRSLSDKLKLENQNENIARGRPMTMASESTDMENDGDRKISVKERMQKFNRMASESDLPKVPVTSNKKKLDKVIFFCQINFF